MRQLELPLFEATNFLMSIREACLKSYTVPPDYLTFFVSPNIFKSYMDETKSCAKFLPTEPDSPEWIPTKYLLRNIRVREDAWLTGLKTRIEEGRHAWESL